MTPICVFDGCRTHTDAKSSRGLCSRHYAYARYHGVIENYPRTREAPTASSPFPLSPRALGRFREKYEFGTLGCWEWQATRTRHGYGMFRLAGELMSAHRVSYLHHVGPIPDGLVLDHLCRNRACVNPAHLEPVEGAENTRRGINPTAINARKTHCIHGHALEGENLVMRGTARQCRACRKKPIECPLCATQMLRTSLAKHLREKHGDR